MKKGFTLVELSIVLVIIGLLIGGILIGQSLVESAKISSQVKQLAQFDIAIEQFRNKYKQLPGDYIALGCTGTYCHDGIITSNTTISSNLNGTWGFVQDPPLVWPNLSDTGFILNENFTAIVPGTGINSGAQKNLPISIMHPEKGTIMVAATKNLVPTSKLHNVYQIADHGQVLSTGRIQGSVIAIFTSMEAFSLDKKMDDGTPYSGNVESTGAVSGNLYFGSGSVSSNCITGGVYTKNDIVSCIPIIKILRNYE